nr:MAG TPA_asm: minor structural protein [Caudoviricetes sp.]
MLKLYNGKAYDFDKEPSDTIQNAYDAKVEFDKGYMLTFKVIIDDKGLHKKIREEMIVVCKGGYKNKENAFRIKERLEFGTYVEFKCPHIFYDLDHKRTKVPSGLFTANDILSFIEQNTEDIYDFKFKHDYIFGDAKLEFGNYKELRDKKDGEKVEPKVEYYNTLELMNKIFNEYDCEFMFDFWTINVYNKLGQDKESLIYEYKNIEDWEGIHSMEGKATRVIAQSDFERTTTYKTKYPNQKLYIHFAYGNDNKGKDFTNTNYQSRKYIGYYVDTKYQNSPNAKDYKWVSMKIPRKTKKKPAFKGDRKVKGITSFMVGTDYRDGIPIKLNKKTFYLHTAFANYLDGKDININDGKGAKYVGFMIDDKKDNTRVKEWFTFNHLTEKGGLLINDRRTLKEKVHLETIVDSPLVNDYAQIYFDTYINNEARTVDELSQDVLDLFDEGWDKPRRTIKCKVKLTNNDRHRLTTLGDYLYYGDNDPCDIYDTVILRYITHNVDERIKCIGFEYDPINDNLEMLKFGSKEKNDTISSSVTSGVKAKLERKANDFDEEFDRQVREVEEKLRRNREEFNHLWLSEKIDFINSFSEYGEYYDDFQAELDRIDAERKQRTEELDKRLADADARFEQSKKEVEAQKQEIQTKANELIRYVDSEIEKSGLKNGETVASFKQDIDNLKGQVIGIEENKRRFTELSQTVSSLSSKVYEINGLSTKYSELKQTVDGMTSTIGSINSDNRNMLNKYSEISQKVDGITSIVGDDAYDFDRKISSMVKQNASEITLSVSQVNGLNYKLDGIESKIQINKDSITQKASNIDLQGKVSFRDLNDDNKDNSDATFIDGGKIITNTIEANHIKAGSIQAKHLTVDYMMVYKLTTAEFFVDRIVGSQANIDQIQSTKISADMVQAGILTSENGVSKINLNDGTFSFYNGSLSIDETYFDDKSNTYRARVHTQSTFRVSYAGRPKVELNSGGIVFFHDNSAQYTPPCGQIRGNEYGRLEIKATGPKEDKVVKRVEIGTGKDGFVMRVYGSLRVGGNLQVDKSIKYGNSVSQGSY